MLELASVNDKMVQAIKTSPPAFSLSKKSLNNFVALIDNVCLLNVCRVSVRVAGNVPTLGVSCELRNCLFSVKDKISCET